LLSDAALASAKAKAKHMRIHECGKALRQLLPLPIVLFASKDARARWQPDHPTYV
jgi:hypothetical protein